MPKFDVFIVEEYNMYGIEADSEDEAIAVARESQDFAIVETHIEVERA